MSETLQVQELLQRLTEKLALSERVPPAPELNIDTHAAEPSEEVPWIGYLNFIHPNRLQVLGTTELTYLDKLGKGSCRDAMESLFSPPAISVIVADGQTSPPAIVDLAQQRGLGLYESRLSGHDLITNARYLLNHLFAEKIFLHGVFLEVMGHGVLITGESSIGKSELALELISRGHRLIADDAPEFRRVAPDIVRGSCPEILQDFLEVRGLGILNIRALFGDSAIKRSKYLRMIVELKEMHESELHQIDRLQGSRTSFEVLGVQVPLLTLPVAPGRNMAVVTEAAVRNYILLEKGYDAAQDFIQRQQQALNQPNS